MKENHWAEEGKRTGVEKKRKNFGNRRLRRIWSYRKRSVSNPHPSKKRSLRTRVIPRENSGDQRKERRRSLGKKTQSQGKEVESAGRCQ